MKKIIGIALIGTLFIVGAGCAPTETKTNTEPMKTPEVSVQLEQKSLPAVGEVFGDFTVIESGNGVVTLSGRTEVAGTYFTSDLTGSLCFAPEEASESKIPDLSNGRESKQFCFSNSAEAKLVLGTEGAATVVIEGYSDQVPVLSAEPMSEFIQVRSK